MKRLLCMILIFSLAMSGCGIFGERIKEPVTFYYLRSEYEYFTEDSVIASEEREASGHRNDLSYLLALYLMGPSQKDLMAPLQKSTKIYNIDISEDEIKLQMSELSASVSDADFSLACACLALTCFDLTDCTTVTVNSGERSVTMTRNGLSLYDNTLNASEDNT